MPSTRQRKPKRQSKPRPSKWISVKLFYDEHEDLITWWEGLPERKRGDTLREIVRAYLAEKSPATLYAEVLRRLETIDRKIGQGVAAAAPAQAMDDSTAERMRANLRKATW
jgi:hypothetical protein